MPGPIKILIHNDGKVVITDPNDSPLPGGSPSPTPTASGTLAYTTTSNQVCVTYNTPAGPRTV